MPPSNFKRKWIKLFIDECLTGTIREDLTPTQRSIWYDFLLLAGRNRPSGCISANENTAISSKRLAALLNVQVNIVTNAKKKFLESKRITIDLAGIIRIVNWDKYQYTDYDRQKPYRQKKSLDEANQAYLAAHPEKVTGSVEMEGYALDVVYGNEKEELARGNVSLEEHEEALMKQNPHVRRAKDKLESGDVP